MNNLNTVLYDSNKGTATFTIPVEYRHFKLFLVNVYTTMDSHFDGISTYLMSTLDTPNYLNTKYGFYYDNKYNYVYLDKDYTFKSNQVDFSIMRVVAFA